MKRALFALMLTMFLFNSDAFACSNEPLTPHEERVFRSRYKLDKKTKKVPLFVVASKQQAFGGMAFASLGLACLLGSFRAAGRSKDDSKSS